MYLGSGLALIHSAIGFSGAQCGGEIKVDERKRDEKDKGAEREKG